MCRDMTIGRLFFRACRTRGWGVRLRTHRNGFALWLGRLMVEAHRLGEDDGHIMNNYVSVIGAMARPRTRKHGVSLRRRGRFKDG